MRSAVTPRQAVWVPPSTLFGMLGATEYLGGPDGWGGWDRNQEAGRVGPDWGREVASVIVHDVTLNRPGAVQCHIVHIGGGYGPGASCEWRELRFAWDVSAAIVGGLDHETARRTGRKAAGLVQSRSYVLWAPRVRTYVLCGPRAPWRSLTAGAGVVGDGGSTRLGGRWRLAECAGRAQAGAVAVTMTRCLRLATGRSCLASSCRSASDASAPGSPSSRATR